MNAPEFHSSTVYPFNVKYSDEPVSVHEVAVSSDVPSPIRYVVFDCWDDDADMSMRVLIHWTEVTRWTKRRWPKGGRVSAVVLQDGRELHASGRYAHHSEESYKRAPHWARDLVEIRHMMSESVLWKVVGWREALIESRKAA